MTLTELFAIASEEEAMRRRVEGNGGALRQTASTDDLMAWLGAGRKLVRED